MTRAPQRRSHVEPAAKARVEAATGTSLTKRLGLVDVYAISLGTMFSSGFFLLPGLASAGTGPSVVLAYLLSGVLVTPSMLSAAELSTAMPRAGGSYFFLDRSLGPMFGTVAGFGNWLSQVLKSAFALVGMGAYLALLVDLPVEPVAVALTLVFAGLNVIGVKSATGIQIGLVGLVLGALTYVLGSALAETARAGVAAEGPLLTDGVGGLVATTGMVFVSYAGVTKVASVSEEVVQPERNLPLGMILSLATATVVYVVGVFCMVALLEPAAFQGDMTPVASVAQAAPGPLPALVAIGLVVLTALAASASTGNAGILSAARYPFAMARDHLIGERFAQLSRHETPAPAIVVTALAMVAAIVVLDVKAIASLASAFLLLVFALINVAVVIMRESHIRAYDPGFRSPLYPWTQIAGVVISLTLIVQMGLLEVLFTAVVSGACIAWYMGYARHRVERHGALFHLFDRLGARRHQGLESELLGIVQEKGLRAEDPFDQEVAWAPVVDLAPDEHYDTAQWRACELLAERVGADTEELVELFSASTHSTATPLSHHAVMPHLLLSEVDWPALVIVRAAHGLDVPVPPAEGAEAPPRPVAAFFVIGSVDDPGQQLRFLAELDARVSREGFVERWLAARDEAELKSALLHDERQLVLVLDRDGPTHDLVDTTAAQLDLPPGTLITLVAREGHTLVPDGRTQLHEGDRLTIVGDPDAIARMRDRYGST